jgi:hypothetical protein
LTKKKGRFMKNYVIITITAVLMCITYNYADWTRTYVGWAPTVLNQIRVGDGRNDGIQRVYAVCEDAHAYEWTYNGTSWTRVDMGQISGSGWCLGIDMGDGRNDGLNRIYITRIDGHVHEYFYVDTEWTITDLGNPNTGMYGVTVGQGRNDGIGRIYACGDGVPPVEYTWTGAVWQ